jgi:hypothetical protein
MRRRGNEAFYGDSGTMLPEQARDEIEQNMGAGHKGNNVDFSQRYAQSESDEHTEEAERLTRRLEMDSKFGIPTDPEKRREYVEQFAELLRHPNGRPQPAQPQEPEEKPFSSNEFWNSEEPKHQIPRKL